MAKSNSKNIRVFPDWFGIDNKSKQSELLLSEKLYSLINNNSFHWTSDHTGFWVESENYYYRHTCSNGKYFNSPIEIKNFDIADMKIVKISKYNVGKILGSEAQRGLAEELDPYYIDLAEQDIKEHPIKEEKFDWELLKREVD